MYKYWMEIPGWLDVVLDEENQNYFENCLFRISLMDKMVILSGNWIYAWRGLNLSNTFDVPPWLRAGPGQEGEKSKVFPRSGEVWTTSGDWKFYA